MKTQLPTSATGRSILLSLALVSTISGCATNPVTGKNELMLIPTSQEISMGESNYGYMQQTQGGTYKGSQSMSDLVAEVGQKLVKVSDRPELPYEFVIVNDGTPNAWAMPGGKIAIHRGLLTELNSEAELAAVLAHEITHAAAKHTAKSMQRQVLIGAGLAGAAVALDDEENQTRNQAIVLAAGVAGNLALQKYSRSHELEADRYGMIYMQRAGYNPEAAVSLQETFVRLGKKPNWLAGLFASHPPSEDRVKANQAFAKELGAGGIDGKERYQAAKAALLVQKPAYDKYDQAKALAEKQQYTQALELIDSAISKHSNEALFYSLKGDILSAQQQSKLALAQYDKAINLNSNYYYPYLKRGMTHKALGNRTHAKLDLEKSQTLMPTENAKQAIAAL